MKKNKTLKSGFTLLELVVALAIFMIFIGAIMNSFISLTTTQQKANLSREASSEAKDLLNYISVEAREKRIDYSCKNNGTDTDTNSQDFSLNCGDIQLDEDLVFITNDGLERIIVRKIQDELTNFYTISAIKQTRPNLISNWEAENETPLHSERLKIRNVSFTTTPGSDPYDYAQTNPTLEQPKVQIVINIERNSKTENATASETEPIVIQTTISSRSYSPQEI
jgi:prepilin-type N-terminal cleavage/methylation domain-containing protein